MTRINCSATVDTVRPASPKGLGTFKVSVWGHPPHDWVRDYTFTARNDNQAAQMGLQKFQEDIAELIAQQENE